MEGRVSKKLSQEFSRTESRILGALSKLDEFLLNQQITTHSETGPGTFRNTNMENQGTNEDDSQSDPHPEVGPSVCQSRHSIDSDTGETHDTMTGFIEQTPKGPHMEKESAALIGMNEGDIDISTMVQPPIYQPNLVVIDTRPEEQFLGLAEHPKGELIIFLKLLYVTNFCY